jgi:steroid delta-isomerase-like uncharacterized protein
MEREAVAQFLEALNTHDPEHIRAALTHDFTFEEVAGPGDPSTIALTEWLQALFDALPDITFRPVRQTQEGNRTYVEFRAIGTHDGTFLNVPATGTMAIVSGVFNLVGESGRVERLRLTVDFGGLRRQLLMAARMG